VGGVAACRSPDRERTSESSCDGRKGEMRVRVGVRSQGGEGSYRGIRAGSGSCC
jgi:hypothetical protein